MFNSHFHISHIFIDVDTRTVIAMTPKVMTTFIRATLRHGYKTFHGRDSLTDPRLRFFRAYGHLPMPKFGGYLDAMARPEQFDAYGIVRNPYWRLHSAWRNKFHDAWHRIEAGTLLQYPPSVRKRDLPRIRQFANARGLQGAEGNSLIPFNTFVEFVVADRRWRPNNHWREQAPMLQIDHFRNMRILRLEDGVTDGLTEIFLRLGFDPRWIKHRLGRPRNVSTAFAENPYDERLAALVFDHFQEDFTRFGYQRDSWRTPEGVEPA